MTQARLLLFMAFSGMLLSQLFSCDNSQFGRYGENALSVEEVKALDLTIDISMGAVGDEPRLKFQLSFLMPRDRMLLKLPDMFLRKDKLYDRMEQLMVSEEGELSSLVADESVLLLTHPQGKPVSISYLFRPDDINNQKPNTASFSAPIIRDNYFQFVGLMAFIYPFALMEAPSFDVTFNWHVPKEVKLFNSYGAFQTVQKVTTDFDKLRDAFFVGGSALRIDKREILGQPVYITLEGTWTQIKDEEFVDVVSRLLTTQRKTWRDEDIPYFFVNFLSSDANCYGNVNFAGTAHPNSFRAFFPSGCKFIPEMKQFISHELTHRWIGKKIKVGKDRGHIDGKWFTEGITDYYGRIFAYRAGVITEDEYFNGLNRQLRKYYISKERKAPMSELVSRMYKKGFSSRSLEDLPYEQGEIMALRLNKRIEKESNFTHSLDDVIRDMLVEADKAGGAKNFSIFEIEDIINRYAKNALNEEYEKIVKGEPLTPPKLEGCNEFYGKLYELGKTTKVSNALFYQGNGSKECKRWLE